ncbi:MAG TPA: thioredoxin family protein [Humisphaera sp.]|nr:thioredoxin family protein [Humisphaera sp.]
MSFTLQLGQPAPDFDLPGTDGKNHSLENFKNCRALVVAFSCNHCPFVVGSEERMVDFALKYAPRDVAFVAINSNETDNHPNDDLPHMIQRAKERNFPFPYLRDDSQDVARAYGALRTPHFFVFGKDSRGNWSLAYTGRMDDNPRQPGKQTTHELADAVDAILCGKAPAVPMTNPIGCNVKWKGKPAHWMPPEACDLV